MVKFTKTSANSAPNLRVNILSFFSKIPLLSVIGKDGQSNEINDLSQAIKTYADRLKNTNFNAENKYDLKKFFVDLLVAKASDDAEEIELAEDDFLEDVSFIKTNKLKKIFLSDANRIVKLYHKTYASEESAELFLKVVQNEPDPNKWSDKFERLHTKTDKALLKEVS